jgi:hypothetical protein
VIEHEFVDTYAILITTRDAPRDKALKFREELRRLLRALEDMHDFPHSFQTKGELGQRTIDEQRRTKQ